MSMRKGVAPIVWGFLLASSALALDDGAKPDGPPKDGDKSGAIAPKPAAEKPSASLAGTIDLADLDLDRSELRGVIERYNVDLRSFQRTLPPPVSPGRDERVRDFARQWLDRIGKIDFDSLSPQGQVDYVLFKNFLRHDIKSLELRMKDQAEAASFVPFGAKIVDLEEARRELKPQEWSKVAATLMDLNKELGEARKALESKPRSDLKLKRSVANRALANVEALRATLREWNAFYDGYDPLYSWWNGEPYKAVDASLQSYATLLRDRTGAAALGDDPRLGGMRGGRGGRAGGGGGPGGGGPGGGFGGGGAGGNGAGGGTGAGGTGGGGNGAGGGPAGPGTRAGGAATRGGGDGAEDGGRAQGSATDRPSPPDRDSEIIGNPIGREALLNELAYEMIPYSPEELLAIAKLEFAWCEAEMKKASAEMGFGDDWKAALEKVKTLYVDPGKQPTLIRDLALEAIDYVEKNDLVTVPPLCRDSWRMAMMTPDRQVVNPFFTGGETISISYPVASMTHDQKMMTMRGNNIHFSRATVHHELIPGHHLEGYTAARYRTYRSPFQTAFVLEGWALYWELLLWDRGFARSPEDRVGMLFWRMHRCARIMFSLGFHLEKMSPKECVDFLVDRVGHERDNAMGEVRRSFSGGYGPLYQAAYLLGGMQFRALHREVVEAGRMTDKEFHDAILRENRIPVELIRASLTGQKLTSDFVPTWKFRGDVEVEGVKPVDPK